MENGWILLLPLAVVGFAYLIKHLLSEVFEEEHHFFGMIAIFLLLFVASAVVLHATIPAPSGSSDIRLLGQAITFQQK